MVQLPLEQAIPRFRQNEERVDEFVNGGPSSTFLTSTGLSVPSISKFLADKNSEINIGAASILALATAQVNFARDISSRFITPKTADPVARDNTAPLQDGDSYYNTAMATTRVRVSGQWQSAVPNGLTTSPTDTTTGRLLNNGNAFGLGLNAVSVTDANTATFNGFWSGVSISNFPTTGSVIGFSAFTTGGASGVQIAMVIGTNGRIYRRHRMAAGGWQPWMELVSGVIGTTDGRAGQNVVPLGVDPSAWATNVSGIQTADGSFVNGGGAMWLVDNLFSDGTNWRYVTASNGATLSVSGASLSYSSAPSGAVGAAATLTAQFQVVPNDGLRSNRGGIMLPHDGFAARVCFNGTGIVAVRGSRNVTSITDNGTGTYTVNLTTALPDSNYSVFGTCGNTAAAGYVRRAASILSTTSAITIEVLNTSGALLDVNSIDVGIVT